MFEVFSYAAATKYVPDWLDNRKRWQAGKDFFYVEILPVNDSEYQDLVVAAKAPEGELLQQGGQDLGIVKKRVTGVFNLRIRCNDETVLQPKNGKELVEQLRPRLDTERFSKLRLDLAKACLFHSVLAAGELKGSGSSSGSPGPETPKSDDGDAQGADEPTTAAPLAMPS